MTLTNFPNGVSSFGVPVVGTMGGIPLTGNWYWVNPAAGSDGNDGTSPETPFATLYRAHAAMTSGNNDVCVLVGNGGTSGTARLSKALAQTIDSSVTAGTLVWSKSACHLIGETAPTQVAQRARIAPPSGTYTQTTFGSGNFVTVSGQGCIFANISLFNGFSTGGADQICWTDTGGRNFYYNMNFGGIADAASAADAGSRSLKIGSGGTGENTFINCTIGLDTVTRSVANASVELAGGSPRNTFRNCIFPFQTSAATVLGILCSGASSIDRWQLFDNCSFVNNVQSTSTTMDGLATLSASAGGLLLMQGSRMVGITEWGSDATSRGQIYVDMAAPAAATGGVSVNPT
jgi:hypothetical protein